MLLVVLITFAVTWLPSLLMEIIRYNGKATPKGNNNFTTLTKKSNTVNHVNSFFISADRSI